MFVSMGTDGTAAYIACLGAEDRLLNGLSHRFSNSQNIYLCQRKPKNNGPFLLQIAILEHCSS